MDKISKRVSFNQRVSCLQYHLDEFQSSADDSNMSQSSPILEQNKNDTILLDNTSTSSGMSISLGEGDSSMNIELSPIHNNTTSMMKSDIRTPRSLLISEPRTPKSTSKHKLEVLMIAHNPKFDTNIFSTPPRTIDDYQKTSPYLDLPLTPSKKSDAIISLMLDEAFEPVENKHLFYEQNDESPLVMYPKAKYCEAVIDQLASLQLDEYATLLNELDERAENIEILNQVKNQLKMENHIISLKYIRMAKEFGTDTEFILPQKSTKNSSIKSYNSIITEYKESMMTSIENHRLMMDKIIELNSMETKNVKLSSRVELYDSEIKQLEHALNKLEKDAESAALQLSKTISQFTFVQPSVFDIKPCPSLNP